MFKMLLRKLRTRHPAACVCDACEADPDDQRCCGWFESSHDLTRGLRVTEHALDDAATVVLLALTPGCAAASAPAC